MKNEQENEFTCEICKKNWSDWERAIIKNDSRNVCSCCADEIADYCEECEAYVCTHAHYVEDRAEYMCMDCINKLGVQECDNCGDWFEYGDYDEDGTFFCHTCYKYLFK